jgi:putative transposase
MRVTRSRELVAAGESPTVVARVAQISRQAIYRVPRKAPPAARRSAPPADDVEAAIMQVAKANQTDGYRIVCALVCRKLGRAVNRKRVLRVMRERRLIQRRRRLDRRRRPGFFSVRRPNELWHLDMTSVWVAEHGWCYLMAAIDCCTREIVGWHLELRCRATEAIALVVQAVAERVSRRAASRSAPTTARRSPRARSSSCCRGWASRTAAAAIAIPSRRRSSRAGSQSSRSAASGCTSSRPSTKRGR